MIKVEKLLENLGFEYKNGGPKNVKIICINPDHHETAPSMYVHRELGIVHCFGCDMRGSIFTLLEYKGITGAEAIKYLMKFAEGGQTEEDLKTALENFVTERETAKAPSDRFIKYTDIELPEHRMLHNNIYLEGRGITPEEMEQWRMSVVVQGKFLGWILIPIYQDGVIRNYFMRSTLGSGKMYGPYPREDVVAGLDLSPDYSSPIAVTEGIFDSVFVRKTGIQAGAALSNRLLPKQIERLKRYKKVIIVPDNDVQGLHLVESAGPLIHTTELFVARLPKNRKDAAVCTVKEIEASLTSAVRWNEYILKEVFMAKKG